MDRRAPAARRGSTRHTRRRSHRRTSAPPGSSRRWEYSRGWRIDVRADSTDRPPRMSHWDSASVQGSKRRFPSTSRRGIAFRPDSTARPRRTSRWRSNGRPGSCKTSHMASASAASVFCLCRGAPFRARQIHPGVDLAATAGAPVPRRADGVCAEGHRPGGPWIGHPLARPGLLSCGCDGDGPASRSRHRRERRGRRGWRVRRARRRPRAGLPYVANIRWRTPPPARQTVEIPSSPPAAGRNGPRPLCPVDVRQNVSRRMGGEGAAAMRG
jgi:hypothetical protein